MLVWVEGNVCPLSHHLVTWPKQVTQRHATHSCAFTTRRQHKELITSLGSRLERHSRYILGATADSLGFGPSGC